MKRPFSCDACDSQNNIFEGKPPQNLDFKCQNWKILNISNTTLKKKKQSKE